MIKTMKWLFIDTTKAGEYRVGFLSGHRQRIAAGTGRSNRYLAALAKTVKESDWDSIDGICVVQGPGSFTAVRTGVLISNLLSRIRHKPLIGVSVEDAHDLDSLAIRIAHGSFPSSGYVAPAYDAEPNITLPKTP
jgi:tRNA A37 threonylcarbamoyladenosine modification protein TsaB